MARGACSAASSWRARSSSPTISTISCARPAPVCRRSTPGRCSSRSRPCRCALRSKRVARARSRTSSAIIPRSPARSIPAAPIIRRRRSPSGRWKAAARSWRSRSPAARRRRSGSPTRLSIIGISNNLGDAKSLITHPATTTHQRLKPEQRAALGIAPGLLRLSVGLEDVDDLIEDLGQALDKAAAAAPPRGRIDEELPRLGSPSTPDPLLLSHAARSRRLSRWAGSLALIALSVGMARFR